MKTGDSSPLPALLGPRMQMAYVVRDLDAALDYWTRVLGVGPFVVFEGAIGGRPVTHHGQPTGFDMTLAFSYWDGMQIELVCPRDDEPSPYREFLRAGREGLHHLGFWPDDFDAACAAAEQAGFIENCVIWLDDGSRSAIYYDAPKHVGIMVEIVPMTPQRRDYFGRIERLAWTWDGTRPIRRYPDRQAFLDETE